ncbi:hypothetical protein HanRHA438_Chr08g0347781 [Helianthus annuus]|nr:hypothetical protein HanIR_Chr08g0363141 [Helianthus annuus]KAJ0897629.1 hypothetical protein HanRHA438_Chr08g0347781 [Helianthus annuus]
MDRCNRNFGFPSKKSYQVVRSDVKLLGVFLGAGFGNGMVGWVWVILFSSNFFRLGLGLC